MQHNLRRWALPALLTLAAACAAVAPASAQSTGIGYSETAYLNRPVLDFVKFRVHATATGPATAGYTGTDFLGGYIDSTTTDRVGTQICPLDTTQDIDTEGWSIPQIGSAVADSGQVWCHLIISDATGGACESGADSLYVGVQVSADGNTWALAGTFKGGTQPTTVDRLDQTRVAGGFMGSLSENGAALARGAPVWYFPIFARTITGSSQVDRFGLNRWPKIRFIVGFPDAKGYKVRAYILHNETLKQF